jgi:hypothetical protein
VPGFSGGAIVLLPTVAIVPTAPIAAPRITQAASVMGLCRMSVGTGDICGFIGPVFWLECFGEVEESAASSTAVRHNASIS